jgi:hypothetical protein
LPGAQSKIENVAASCFQRRPPPAGYKPKAFESKPPPPPSALAGAFNKASTGTSSFQNGNGGGGTLHRKDPADTARANLLGLIAPPPPPPPPTLMAASVGGNERFNSNSHRMPLNQMKNHMSSPAAPSTAVGLSKGMASPNMQGMNRFVPASQLQSPGGGGRPAAQQNNAANFSSPDQRDVNLFPFFFKSSFCTYSRLKMEPWRVCRPMVADSHHFNEEQDPDLNPPWIEKPDPEPHLSEKRDPDQHQIDANLQPCRKKFGRVAI